MVSFIMFKLSSSSEVYYDDNIISQFFLNITPHRYKVILYTLFLIKTVLP